MKMHLPLRRPLISMLPLLALPCLGAPVAVPSSYTEMSQSDNGAAGGALLDTAIAQGTLGPDLNSVLNSLNDLYAGSMGASAEADTILAAFAGTSITTLGSAALSNMDHQLQHLRNRMGGFMKAGQRNYWISGEANRSVRDADGVAAGHDVDNWGGSLGAEFALSDRTNLGFAFTSLYGDLHSNSIDGAKSDMNTYYFSILAQRRRGKWHHHMIFSLGLMDVNLHRYVPYAQGRYSSSGSTDGTSLGLMYELGYEMKLNEKTLITPVFNIALIHNSFDAYTESGSDASLHVEEQINTYATVGAGARLVTTLDFGLELGARGLLKADTGTRQADVNVALASTPDHLLNLAGAETGAVGIELGVSANMPVWTHGGIFVDARIDLRDGQQDYGASAGFRMSF